MSSSWFKEGYGAYFKNKDIDECPYDQGTEPYNEWQDGWIEAEADEDSDRK